MLAMRQRPRGHYKVAVVARVTPHRDLVDYHFAAIVKHVVPVCPIKKKAAKAAAFSFHHMNGGGLRG